MQLRRDERGVTLSELLVAIAILGIIIAPLGNALISYIRNTEDTSRRLGENHDVQLAAAYFAQDVQNIGVRNWTVAGFPLLPSIEQPGPAGSGPQLCGTEAAVIRFAWDDPNSVSGLRVIRIAYVVRTVGPETQLRRLKCAGPAPGTSVVQSETVVIHNLFGTPAVTCSATCHGAAAPLRITMIAQVKNPKNSTAIPVTLVGQWRQT